MQMPYFIVLLLPCNHYKQAPYTELACLVTAIAIGVDIPNSCFVSIRNHMDSSAIWE